MILVLLGINHKTAPVELREKLAGAVSGPTQAYLSLQDFPEIQEVMIYSTCNRLEILAVTNAPQALISKITNFLSAQSGVPVVELEKALYVHREEKSIRHIFQVASGLDSMVIGEPQVLGQIKEAYRQATDSQATGTLINRLLHKTFSVAKRVRTETGIGGHAVSISYAAVELARKIFGSLTGKVGMLIGAGEMAELAIEHLKHQGVAKIVVANRTLERGLQLARRFQGEAVSLAELESQLLVIDILISSTGSPDLILNRDQVKAVMRRRKQRPLFLIDIAVPRDLDPGINNLDNVYLYNIDDLQGVIEVNRQYRREEANKAERIIEAETLKFLHWRETLAVFPTIVDLREKARQICVNELKKTLNQLGPITPEQISSLEVLTESITHKLLHDPILYLKRNHHPKDRRHQEVDLARRLFNLDADGPNDPDEADNE